MTEPGFVAMTRHRAGEEFAGQGGVILAALGARPGFLRGRVLRAAEETDLWTVVSEWVDLGSWRRAISSSDVKLAATAELSTALQEPSGWEVAEACEGGPPAASPRDRFTPRSR